MSKNDAQNIKERAMEMPVAQIETLLNIIGDLGFLGYRVSMCKLKGGSYQQCANRMNISKRLAQFYFEKCRKNGYDISLMEIFNLK